MVVYLYSTGRLQQPDDGLQVTYQYPYCIMYAWPNYQLWSKGQTWLSEQSRTTCRCVLCFWRGELDTSISQRAIVTQPAPSH